MSFDTDWLARHIGNLVLENAATRAHLAARVHQQEEKIRALSDKLKELGDGAFIQANNE